jgi:hypothetical protein
MGDLVVIQQHVEWKVEFVLFFVGIVLMFAKFVWLFVEFVLMLVMLAPVI